MLLKTIILLPFIGFLVAGYLSFYINGQKKDKIINFVAWMISTFTIGLSTVLLLVVINELFVIKDFSINYKLYEWFRSSNLTIDMQFDFTFLNTRMLLLVLCISLLVHFYSYFYISKKDNLARFQSYLSLFTFSMLILVLSDNLVQMFIGWELISLTSYLLIAYWYQEEVPNLAAVKSFLINRFADIGFLLGIFATYLLFGSVRFVEISANVLQVSQAQFDILGYNFYIVNLIGFLFLIAAFAKSAQIGFHIWLPDAMEAPTPVSALLHAATMVTAGVFLIIKLSAIYQIDTWNTNFIELFASLTILLGALLACVQTDIKKIIAYSTISQLGYMFLAIGIDAYNASFFHLINHAFFKALLFLAAGSVIHGMSGEQDITKMGNLWRKMPFTYITMLVGVVSLIGLPFTSGYYSKELILNFLSYHAQESYWSYLSAITGVFLTTFYALRMFVLVFHGNVRYDKRKIKPHESSFGLLLVLFILSIFSIMSGKLFFNNIVGEYSKVLWNGVVTNVTNVSHKDFSHHITYLTLILIISAIISVYFMYSRYKELPSILSNKFLLFYKIIYNKFYFDFVYERIIVRLSLKFAKFLGQFDNNVLDKFLMDNTAGLLYKLSRLGASTQKGYVNYYAIVMVFGVILALLWLLLKI